MVVEKDALDPRRPTPPRPQESSISKPSYRFINPIYLAYNLGSLCA